MLPEICRYLIENGKVHAEAYYPRGGLGAPCYEWWDLELAKFKYDYYKVFPNTEYLLEVIDEITKRQKDYDAVIL